MALVRSRSMAEAAKDGKKALARLLAERAA
jgi:hypothetical protein